MSKEYRTESDQVKCGCDEFPECTHVLYWCQGVKAGHEAQAQTIAELTAKLDAALEKCRIIEEMYDQEYGLEHPRILDAPTKPKEARNGEE